MQTANAIKIGVWIVIAVAILIFGTRYFQGLALGGSKVIVAEFERVDGLIAGNTVQMRGVRIGNVNSISIDGDRAIVVVSMNINQSATIREGSKARLLGIAALGDMRIEIEPGPIANPIVPDGAMIAAAAPVDLVRDISEAAGGYMVTVEAILEKTDQTLENLNESLTDGGDIRGSLASLRSMTETLDALLAAESIRISNAIQNFENISANLDTLTSTDGDSASIVTGLHRSLDQLDQTLMQTQSLTANLDSVLMKVNAGKGTLGMLANDPALYNHMDSVAINLNRLLEDFRRDPKRYLKEVKAVDIF
jgi:phospholipid/cholesterol/gamma-HCH transport system substrate-binding protein